MKNTYQAKTLKRVLICSTRDLKPELSDTIIGRQGVEVYRVEKFNDAKLVGPCLGVQVILVDRDLPAAAGFIRQLRKEASMRKRSIAVLTRDTSAGSERDLLNAGANAVLCLPPDAGWDDRFAKLLDVPVRQQARMVVHVKGPKEPEYTAAVLNLSPGGMLLATDHLLRVKDEIKFRLALPDLPTVVGSGRVARDARPTGFGVEFTELEGEGKDAVRDFLHSAQMG